MWPCHERCCPLSLVSRQAVSGTGSEDRSFRCSCHRRTGPRFPAWSGHGHFAACPPPDPRQEQDPGYPGGDRLCQAQAGDRLGSTGHGSDPASLAFSSLCSHIPAQAGCPNPVRPGFADQPGAAVRASRARDSPWLSVGTAVALKISFSLALGQCTSILFLSHSHWILGEMTSQQGCSGTGTGCLGYW